MVYQWEPQTMYDNGAVVEYEGHLYKIIQPHRSQSDWTPPVTPALWGRLPEQEGGAYRDGSTYHGVDEDHRNQQPGQPQPGQADPQKAQQGWLTDKRKHEMEIGGGLLAAGAIGMGIFEWSKHHSAEKEKKEAWQQSGTVDAWRQGAQARTDNSDKINKAVMWVLVRGTQIPNNAIQCGRDGGGEPLYIARSHHQGGLHIGKAGRHLSRGASIAFQGSEVEFDEYEVLVGDERAVRWVHVQGRVNVQGFQPVEGGRDSNGHFIFATRCQWQGGVQPGGCVENEDHACFGYGGSEQRVSEYEVLAYSQ